VLSVVIGNAGKRVKRPQSIEEYLAEPA